jgi:predicted lipid-binding transport protein (Tim44 family)
MHSNPCLTVDPRACARRRLSLSIQVPLAFWVVLVLTAISNEACAAVMGGLTTSVGLLVALTALLVAKSWQGYAPATVLSALASMTVFVAVVVGIRRSRETRRRAASARSKGRDWLDRGSQSSLLPALPVGVSLPAGFERAPLLAELRLRFVQLQAAWDLGERQALAGLTTPEMLDELCFELPSSAPGIDAGRTEVVTLQAVLLGFEVMAGAYLASVEFSGLIRESPDAGAAPFQELWMLAKSKDDGSDWKLARHQALL